jgi:Tfp pilus assembly protein PilX
VKARLRQEDGIALVLALGFMIVLSIMVFGMVSYVTSNQHNAQNSNTDSVARGYAEAALDAAYSRLEYVNSASQVAAGNSPSKADLLGCTIASNPAGQSNCSSPTVLCVPVVASCPSGTYAATAGTATAVGFYTGSSSGTYASITKASGWWILQAIGYARNSSGKLDAKTVRATVQISAGGAGAVASVWNHLFLTAPLVPNTCQADFAGNGTVLDVPLYVIGNLCFSGQNINLKEATGGQAVDLQVGGKLILSGSNSAVGDYSTTPATGITSGVVAGGCNATGIANATTSCSSGSYRYAVKATGTYFAQDEPEMSDAQIESNYSTFDPGPLHTCKSSTTPAAPNANPSTFDYNLASGEGSSGLPDVSGLSLGGAAFELTPSSSYACIAQGGLQTGYLIWNNGASTITVDDGTSNSFHSVSVPSKYLAIGGSIFIDANMTITNSLTYEGTGIIETSGTITLQGNNQQICAQNTSCTFTNWQGSTGNNDMLTLATTIKSNTGAINFSGQNETYMGSLWTQPSSKLFYSGNSLTTGGPVSVGSMTINANTFAFKPLPVIKNMPVGAPVPPNVSATISPLYQYP